VKQISLFSPEFDERIKALRSEEAKASEMEHAIKDEIHVKIDEDPAFYSSLRERLEKIIEDRKAKRIDAVQQLKLFEQLKAELRGHAKAAENVGLSATAFAIYGLIAEPKPLKAAEAKGKAYGEVDEARKALAGLLEEQLAPQLGIVDWQTKDDVQREMRRLIKRQLVAANYPAERRETVAESVVDLMKRRRGS
jgi:type I restriction enzyme R subunit